MEYFRQLDEASPIAKMVRFGISPEGRDLNLFIISSDKQFTPQQAQTNRKPIILIQCCIHPGESEGKDAAMMLARDLIIHKKYPKILENTIINIIPIFNADGHERFGPYNRINQDGPVEMGWRVTATRLNLNRDFVKADTPELRAWLAMYNQWKPHMLIDCHTTDGVDHQYELTYKIDTHEDFGGTVSAWAKNDFLPAVLPACEEKGHIFGPFARLVDRCNPAKGLVGGVWPPMLSNPYATVRNRGGLLIETHSLKPYPVRVKATYDFILTGLQEIANRPERLTHAVAKEDERASQLGRTYVPEKKYALRYRTLTDKGDSLIYRGYRIKVERGQISDAEYLSYTDEIWDIPSILFEHVEPTVSISPPLGYLIPQQWQKVIQVVKLHGVKTYQLANDVSGDFEGYRFSKVTFRANSYEGRQRVNYQTHAVVEKRSFTAGTIYVPLGCPESKIIMQMLEPQAPDALVSWGFFNTIFEQREYFETYVMEPMAQKMAAENPALMKEFESKLKADSSFAANPRQRLQFFYERTPFWDKEENLYPVVRVTEPLNVEFVEY
jgi:hypothetical protein